VDGVVIEWEKARVTYKSEVKNIIQKPSVSIAEHMVGMSLRHVFFRFLKMVNGSLRLHYRRNYHKSIKGYYKWKGPFCRN